jgi:acetylornithine aminotransferase
LPIGACLAKGEVAELFVPGSHGSTFGGNPLVTRVATSVLDVIEKHDYLKHVQIMGDYLTRELKTALANYSCVRQIRSKGLMIGIELDRECPELRYKGLHKNILINVTQKHIIRLTPPLILQPDHADSIVDKLKILLDEL